MRAGAARSHQPAGAGQAAIPGGGRIAYRVDGAADLTGERTVLLCRPLIGSMELWAGFRELLAARARVVSFDPRGIGGSSAAPVANTTRSMARDAVALLDHLDLPAVHVFGLSLGGMVASWMAIDAPRRVRRLVLASTLVRGGPAALPSLRGWRGARRALTVARCFARGGQAAAGCMARNILSPEFQRAHPDQSNRIAEATAADSPSRAGLLALLLATALHDVRRQLASVQAPTLILCGGRDPLIAPDAQRDIARRMPDARIAVIENAGHELTLEQPRAAADQVLAFLGL